jgi:hypothetical protein
MQPTQSPTTPTPPVRKPWRRPSLKQLHISLDTAFTILSGTDGGGQTGA